MMKNSSDPIHLTSEHLESIQNDLLSREFRKKANDPASELSSLREFNAELLIRIGEFRKRNLELSASENYLKQSLAMQQKKQAELEAASLEKDAEINSLQAAFIDQQNSFAHYKDEWARKLAKISDENWAKNIEIETLTGQVSEAKEENERFCADAEFKLEEARATHAEEMQMLRQELASAQSQLQELQSENQTLAVEVSGLRDKGSEHAAQIQQATELIANFEEAIEQRRVDTEAQQVAHRSEIAAANQLKEQAIEAGRAREAQLIAAFENLRAEYSSIDHCYRQATESVAKLRSELRQSEQNAETALTLQQEKLSAEFEERVETLRTENTELRRLLQMKNNRIETEQNRLQTWREQLSFLDQHLRQQSDSLKKEKAEVMKQARHLAHDLGAAQNHPFAEYLGAAELEIEHLQTQLKTTSALSPLRPKLESRFALANEHRTAIKDLLDQAEQQTAARLKVVQAILKS